MFSFVNNFNIMIFNGNAGSSGFDDLFSGAVDFISGLVSKVFGMGLGLLALIIALVVAFGILALVLAMYLIPAICLFKMAKKAGYKYPWFSFIPFLKQYLEYVLPRKEYKLLFLNTKKRNNVALALVLITTLGTPVLNIVFSVLTMIPFIGVIFALLYFLVALAMIFTVCATTWKKYYDICMTYKDKSFAIPWSIICTVLVFMPIVLYLLLVKKNPDYGENNFNKVEI